MSDMNATNGGDPFAPEVVEDSIAGSMRPGAPATSTTGLIRTLAGAYALPPAADAVLARSRATLARRAAALDSRGHQTGGPRMSSSDSPDSWPTAARSITRPTEPPRRRINHFATVLRTAAAVLVVALLSAGFYALLRGMQRQGAHPTPTATHAPVSSTATPDAPTPTTIPPQPPAPAGVYVTMQGTLIRLNPSTGAVEHTYPLASSSQAYVGTPVVANGVVYLTYRSTAAPSESDVVAVSATSGAELWRTKTADLLTQLSLADGTLYGGTASTGTGGTGSDTFYALSASDGSLRWTFHTATLGAVPLVTGGVVYLADQPQNASPQHIRALRASDGSQLWDTPLPQACGMVLDEAVDQGMAFVACGVNVVTGPWGNGGVYALRASDGSELWHSSTDGQPYVMSAGAGHVYVSRGGKNAAGAIVTGLDALAETSGAVRWQVPNGGGLPVLDGTTVYAGLSSGRPQFSASSSSDLAAFSASSGTLLWTYSLTNQRVQGGPVIASGVVYEILNEQVVAISAANGSVLWRSPALGRQHMGPDGLSVVTGG